MRAAAVGDNCIDVYPKLDRSYCTGNAVDFAVHMQRLGVPTALISVVGDDEYGRWMVETLSAEGLDLTHLRTVPGATAVCFMDMVGNERVHGDYVEGVMKAPVFSPDDIAFAAGHELVHSAFWGHAERHLPDLGRAGALVCFDYATGSGDPMVAATLPHVDYAFFSFPTKTDVVRAFLRDCVAAGPRVAIATFGEHGSWAWDGQHLHEAGIVTVEVTNTIGCGDSFIAGFMRGVLDEDPLPGCLRRGAEVAAEVVSYFGPWPERTQESAE